MLDINLNIAEDEVRQLVLAAGAVYKINEGTGGTVLVNMEILINIWYSSDKNSSYETTFMKFKGGGIDGIFV